MSVLLLIAALVALTSPFWIIAIGFLVAEHDREEAWKQFERDSAEAQERYERRARAYYERRGR